ncbi:ThiF family adenylyltransferase [Mesorhizobium escarrei]|nr:ThiF family adenylyltransferase [Mesorhizobium escarrei]
MTPTDGGRLVLFGNAAHDGAATRVTFDGWVAVTGPQHVLSRYAEREHCSLAPILAAALAVSETFLGFAGIDLLAGKRVVGLSLWRPDLGHTNPEAVGPVVTALPKQAWLLGLGHLGNAYLWALATLPFADPTDVLLYLLDFDKVEKSNTETGVLFRSRDIGRLKTRVCSNWLERFGIKSRLVERRFDKHTRRLDGEPALALSGFDNNEARQLLVGASFGRVVDSGLGGTATNFDSISFRTWPNARAAVEIWPVLSAAEKADAEEAILKAAEENPAYRRLKRDRCGIIEYAGKSVAVPFVGMVAATLVMADTLRVLNDGERLQNLKVRLGELSGELAVTWSKYTKDDLAAVAYAPAQKY